MKIKGNLLNGARPLPAQPVALVVWLLAAVMGTAASLLFLDAARLREQRADLDARLQWLQAEERRADSGATLPSRPELEAMGTRVQALNALANVRGMDAFGLLSWFEQHLPGNVRLVSLNHKAREGETYLIAEASGSEPLSRLLREIEKEPRFSEALLAKQGTRNVQGRTGAIQYEIRIRHQ